MLKQAGAYQVQPLGGDRKHQAPTVHALVTIFLTFLHISGQMGWKLMAQNPKV